MSRQKIAVVGSKGYIGRNVIERFKTSKHEVHGIASNQADELRSAEFWNRSEFDTVIWLASKVNPWIAEHRPDVVSNEVDYFTEACEVMSKAKIRLIYSSSGGAIYSAKNPPFSENSEALGFNHYGRLKAKIEKCIQESGINFSILRLSNAYGADQVATNGQAVIAAWLSRVAKAEPIVIFGNTSISRDFVHVSDVASAVEKVVDSQHANQVFNIGSGEATTLEQILTVIRQVTDTEIHFRVEESRSIDRQSVWLDISKSSELLNWQPLIALDKGIAQAWQAMNLMDQR